MTWTNTALAYTIRDMSESDRDPLNENSESETFRYTPRDKAALLAVMKHVFPTLRNRSEILRAAFRLGLPLLARDPAKLYTAEAPDAEALTGRPPPEMSPASGTKVPGGMTTRTFIESGGPTLPPPTPPPAPEPPTDETPPPATPPTGPKPRKPRDPSKPRRSRKDPMREPTDDELDRYRKRSR